MGDRRQDVDRDCEQFTSETRVVSIESVSRAPAALQKRLPRSDPLPAIIQLLFRVTDHQGQTNVTAMTKAVVILGRVTGIADVAVADEAASRYHACVIHRAGKFTLMDIDSTNGTFLNGESVQEAEINNGDEIRIGGASIIFQVAPRI